jgi:hypothetical protein
MFPGKACSKEPESGTSLDSESVSSGKSSFSKRLKSFLAHSPSSSKRSAPLSGKREPGIGGPSQHLSSIDEDHISLKEIVGLDKDFPLHQPRGAVNPGDPGYRYPNPSRYGSYGFTSRADFDTWQKATGEFPHRPYASLSYAERRMTSPFMHRELEWMKFRAGPGAGA